MKKLDLEQKQRLRSLLIKFGTVLGIGLAYLLFVMLTGWGIPCVFYLATGLYCPGCGISRMFMAMAQLDFRAAIGYNLLVFCLLPFFLVLLIVRSAAFVRKGSEGLSRSKAEMVFYLVAFVLCVVFTVLRNMPAYAWLAP